MQSSESLGVLTLIFPLAPVVQGWTTACDWLEAPLLGHSPCHRFIESCPQGVLRTIRVVIQPESSGCVCGKMGHIRDVKCHNFKHTPKGYHPLRNLLNPY